MTQTTITEALAEIKLVNAKIEKKKAFVLQYLARQDGVKDPLEKQGGSFKAVESELQAINDLFKRVIKIRLGINDANAKTTLTILDKSLTVAEWLVWKRDVAPKQKDILNSLQINIGNLRNQARKQGQNVMMSGQQPESPADFIVNVDELALAKQIEALQEMTDSLDGKLSLHNATTTVEV